MFYAIIRDKFFKILADEADGIFHHTLVRQAMFHKAAMQFQNCGVLCRCIHRMYIQQLHASTMIRNIFQRIRDSNFWGNSSGCNGAMQAFCSSIDSPNSFKHIFQCLYQFLATTHSFWRVLSSYTHLEACHGVVLIFFLSGSGILTRCLHNR